MAAEGVGFTSLLSISQIEDSEVAQPGEI
jgi:hypothetical protein